MLIREAKAASVQRTVGGRVSGEAYLHLQRLRIKTGHNNGELLTRAILAYEPPARSMPASSWADARQRILGFFEANPGASYKELRAVVNAPHMGGIVSKLVKRGDLRVEGTPRHYRYYTTQEAA